MAGLREVGREPFLEWTAGALFAFPNLDEGRLLSGADEPGEIMSSLLERYSVVALKLGASGAMVASRDGQKVKLGPRDGVVVDSTGAGDAFCAGFLASWMRGGDLEACALAAVCAAARAVGQVGARPRNVPPTCDMPASSG